MEQYQNHITLRGTLTDLPVFSHENHGRRFYKFFLEVQRLSGAIDTLPVIADLSALEQMDLTGGSKLRVEGQIRSHNRCDETGRHLLIFVFASELIVEEGECINELTISGPVCREPNYRTTPLGREICDMMLAVPRAFHRADYLPCILWGRTAQLGASCHTRDWVQIDGRLQSRIYTKYTEEGAHERTAYEISALRAFVGGDPE